MCRPSDTHIFRACSTIELSASFPGQTGFCGGCWSPLMVFLDESRPKFTQVVDFPLNTIGKTDWPEQNSPGYRIAIDLDRSWAIDPRLELFGQIAEIQNGFEALKKLDSNRDGLIDIKDKHFNKLILWQDKNGDGKSHKIEMQPLFKLLKQFH